MVKINKRTFKKMTVRSFGTKKWTVTNSQKEMLTARSSNRKNKWSVRRTDDKLAHQNLKNLKTTYNTALSFCDTFPSLVLGMSENLWEDHRKLNGDPYARWTKTSCQIRS